MTNAELVRECLKIEAADWDIVNEMMTRLHPGWQDEPDSPEWECPVCKRWYSGETVSGCANGHPATVWRRVKSPNDQAEARGTATSANQKPL